MFLKIKNLDRSLNVRYFLREKNTFIFYVADEVTSKALFDNKSYDIYWRREVKSSLYHTNEVILLPITTTSLKRSKKLVPIAKKKLSTTIPDIIRFVSKEALNCMLAYYKVVLKRFIDNIATKVIEVKLLGEITTLFILITAFEMPKDLIRQIADPRERFGYFLLSNRAIRSSSSCSSADMIDSELAEGQSRLLTPDLLEQPVNDKYSLEYPIEPGPLESPSLTKGGKKRKKTGSLPANF
ncbi:Male sterility NAD-binding [Penicillium cf. viridicatum]|uniref:Male sterility NAD-binding n=1 Tax=Penicillium cf. viridicatum TaxID=2972119 RepID=A0A9W9MJB2_9EURO|nr:Male sterility NAD-binding [Penicillium cf. viridicatum]